MYEFFTGQIVMVMPDHIVMVVGDIGYRLQVANPYRYTPGETMVTVYVYQAVTETALTLFGFADAAEKQLFLKLISVKGIGPSSALAILATPDQGGLIQAINQENVSFLTKFPGIGKKTAGQIVLDLKGKLDDLAPAEGADLMPVDHLDVTENQALDDASAALVALGYRETDVKRVAKHLATLPLQSTNDYLSAGLKQLSE